jgi:putative flippase GtrA
VNRRIYRFIINGIIATVIHTLVVYILNQRYGVEAGIANVLAFLTATAISYISNTTWTFETVHSRQMLFRYMIVTSAGCLVTWILATICAALGFAWWVAIVCVVMTIPALTWTAHKRWTYAS